MIEEDYLFSIDVTQSSKVVEVIQRGDLQRSLRCLRELQPWSAPPLLAHLQRSVSIFLSQHQYKAVRNLVK